MKVLVTGATGSQGGAVVWALLEKGHTPYVFTRHPDKAADLVRAGAVIAQGDLEDAASVAAAVAHVDAVAMTIPAFVPNPLLIPTYARNLIEAAGEKYIVYNTSGPVIAHRTGNPGYDIRLDILDRLKQSGAPYVVIQPTAYLENLLGPWTRPNIIARDTLTYPVEVDTPLGWIATRDVAALMVAALERPALAGSHFVVSGVENLTGPELAERFTRGLQRPVAYEAQSLDDFAAALDAAFGPGAGEGGKAGYQFQRDNKDLLTMWVDMTPVLATLPVTMTSVEAWARQFKEAFMPQPEQR